jgi:polysaccharide biosynthesis protein PslL
MDSRVKYIDIAKGISIFLVAIFHSRLPVYFPETIWAMSLFRMPLFFLLSGVFFSFLVKPQKFILEKSEVLLKPYFSVLLIVLAIDAISGSEGLLYQLNGILYGNGDTIKWAPLWFLTHLFAVYVFTYALFCIFKFHLLPVTLQTITLITFMLCGTLFVQFFWYMDIQIFNHSMQLPGLPFSIDIILITSVFFISGSLLKDTLMAFKPNLLLLSFAIAMFYLICIYSDAHIDLNKRVYNSPLYSTLGALFGIYAVLSLAWYISKVEWLSYLPLRLGEASLYILIFHVFIQENTYPYLVEGVSDETTLMVMGTVSFLLSVLLPIGIKWVVLRSDLLSLLFIRFKANNLLQRTFYARR